MQPKILSKRVLTAAILSGTVIFAALLLSFPPKNSTGGEPVLITEKTAAFSGQEQTNAELPVRVRIPSIHVDASVEYVGLTSGGAMDTPKGPDDVAWFNLGPHPGEKGSAVIAGHRGWYNNMPAVFNDLHTLSVGDKIFIEDEKGTITTFVVREVQIYDKDESVPYVFSSSDGKAHLNLITCTGAWNETERTRSERIVVFTDKE